METLSFIYGMDFNLIRRYSVVEGGSALERRLTAILTADVVGFSKMMAADEEGTLELLKVHRSSVFEPAVSAHNGRIIKLMGDGTLVEFASVVDAVKCAVAIQSTRNSDEGQVSLRIGVNLGDVIVDGDDIYGDGVNVAARLEALAEPGGICISGRVYDQVENKLDFKYDYMGEQTVKNISKPVQCL